MLRHNHEFKEEENNLICSVCGLKRLKLKRVSEDLLKGIRKDGIEYSVRRHRKAYFMPDLWKEFYNALPREKQKRTAQCLIQTGARINEAWHIEKRDIDFDRNTIKLRVTKTKAKKAGEERGTPRTIPISSEYAKELKKHFQKAFNGTRIGILKDSAFNIALKNTLKKINCEDWYMYSCHNVRKTHGNYLKLLSSARMIDCDATEICLRMGHDMNTFLTSYGSSGAVTSQDLLTIKEILGDLYQQKRW